MTSRIYAFSNSLHRKLRTLQPEKHQLKDIAVVAQLLNPSGMVLRRESGLESESLSLLSQIVQSIQHHPPRLQCDTSRIEARETERDRIGVHIFQHAQLIPQEKRRERSFSSTIGTGNDDNLWRRFIHAVSSALSITILAAAGRK